MEVSSFNRVTIDPTALENNYRSIQRVAGSTTPVMAMIKADAYGHGAVEAAAAFTRGGCSIFGVAELREAVVLREAGVAGQIYVTIGFAEEDVALFFSYDLIPVIYSIEAAKALSAAATGLNREISVHVKVDTGMGRLGFYPEELPSVFDTIRTMPGLKLCGIMSHFPEADNPLSTITLEGIKRFTVACDSLKNEGEGLCHIANSGAVLNFPSAHKDMVRAGIALYGYNPAGKVEETQRIRESLRPAMSFRSRVLQVKDVPAGTGISYGHTYVTEKDVKIAVLPVGYEDGLSRSLSNKGEVLIRGQRARVRGRICMNMCMVDVTEITDIVPGDEAVFLGSQGDETITADDIAEKMDSISYEVLCMIGHNNIRNYQVG